MGTYLSPNVGYPYGPLNAPYTAGNATYDTFSITMGVNGNYSATLTPSSGSAATWSGQLPSGADNIGAIRVASNGDTDVVTNNLIVTGAVPEPSTYAIVAAGIGVLLTFRHRRAS